MLNDADIADLVAASYGQEPTWLAGDDIRAVGSAAGGEFVVACPGTTDLLGWLDDFSYMPCPFPELGLYHEGFGAHGLALAALVLPTLPAQGRIVFAGHSLGGQIALVLAAAWAAAKRAPARVVVLGCPRGAFAGNLRAGALLGQALELVEYRNHGDPIPNVPPWPMWKHAAKGTMLGDPVRALAPSMANHAIGLYQANVRALATPAPAPSAWRGTTR